MAIFLFKGGTVSIEYAQDAGGKYPAKKFIDGLKEDRYSKIVKTIKALHKKGIIFNKDKFKRVKGADRLFEFKASVVRVFGYYSSTDRRVFVLTNGFIKKDRRLRPVVIKKAKRIMEDHESRA